MYTSTKGLSVGRKFTDDVEPLLLENKARTSSSSKHIWLYITKMFDGHSLIRTPERSS